jgi:hypothetical protein
MESLLSFDQKISNQRFFLGKDKSLKLKKMEGSRGWNVENYGCKRTAAFTYVKAADMYKLR